MQQYHHKSIKRFSLDGQIHDEATIPRLKDEYTRLLITQMRFDGYVPRLDINPDFTIDFEQEKNIFLFEISVYGTYVGKRQSEWITGIDTHKPIYTQKNKSSESSQAQVSQ